MKNDLLDAYLSGDLRGESATFIEAALKSDADLREKYFQQVRMDAALRILLQDEDLAEVPTSQFAAGVMASLEAERPTESASDRNLAKSVLTEILDERARKPRPMGWWDLAKAAVITAVAAGLAILVLQRVNVTEGDADLNLADRDESASRFVARITTENKGTTWGTPLPLDLGPPTDANGAELPIVNEDGWVRPGRLTIESGVAEVTFNSGARVFVEGPAVLEVERPNRAFLESGRLTAEVPKAASGFVINTPRINVVDIGTRFGVSVEDGGNTEVHVMQGVVEVSRLTGNAVPMIVEEGIAVRADGRTRSELQVIAYAGDQFSLKVTEPAKSRSHRFLHYSFDESGGSEIEDLGRGIEGGPFYASIFPNDQHPDRPKRSVGRIGGGLVVAPGERFDSPLLSGFAENHPLTAGLWVRIPPRPEQQNANAILTLVTQKGQQSESAWNLSWNLDGEPGVAGAPRVESGDGFLVGSTDLRDGRWHHVGFRFLGGDSPDVATHVHLFVDGKLEDLSAHQSGPANTGRIHRLQSGGRPGEPVFEGAIDEIYAFPEALPTNQFQQLAEESEIP